MSILLIQISVNLCPPHRQQPDDHSFLHFSHSFLFLTCAPHVTPSTWNKCAVLLLLPKQNILSTMSMLLLADNSKNITAYHHNHLPSIRQPWWCNSRVSCAQPPSQEVSLGRQQFCTFYLRSCVTAHIIWSNWAVMSRKGRCEKQRLETVVRTQIVGAERLLFLMIVYSMKASMPVSPRSLPFSKAL